MTFPKARLVVAAVLFLGWLGFLSYLVSNRSQTILSRPQFSVAQLVVVAEVEASNRPGTLSPRVKIVEVSWAADAADQKLADQSIEIAELASFSMANGEFGPDNYILPLQRTAAGTFEIAPVPRDFGLRVSTHVTLEGHGLFSHRVARRVSVAAASELRKGWQEAGFMVSMTAEEELRIYRLDSSTRGQLDQFVRARANQ